tara:strand:+ start:122 stop:571 length:450 start_codon:yes stop_codon:yes gene_type:complete
MAGPTNPELSTPYVRNIDNKNQRSSIDGATAGVSGTALLTTDCGSRTFADMHGGACPALSVTSTAKNLAQLNTNKVDVIARRGIQLRADSANSKDIVVGPVGVVAHATPANVVGMPLPAGTSIFLEVTQLSSIHAVAESGTQILHWLAY